MCIRDRFNLSDLVDPHLMPAAFVFAFQPAFYNHQPKVFADYAGAEGEHICIVVLPGKQRGITVGADHAADALDLVRRDRNSNPGSAADDPLFTFAARNRIGGLQGVFRIVAALSGIGAVITVFQMQLVEVCLLYTSS